MIKESDIFNNILIINVKLHYCPIEKSFLKCSVDFFPFSSLLFLSFFLWGQNYIIRANKILIFKKYIISTITKRERKKVRNTTLGKCIFNRIWEIKPDSTW